MKITLLLFVLLIAGNSLWAQLPQFTSSQNKMLTKHQFLLKSLLNKQSSSNVTAQKPTGMKQRVIAQTYGFEGEPVHDSIRFKYSGSRGSKFNYNNQNLCYVNSEYLGSFNDHYDSDYFPFDLNIEESQSIDVLADSVIHYIRYNNTYLRPFSNAKYRADNKTTFYQNWWVTDDHTELSMACHQFNANGYLTQVSYVYNHSQVPDFDTGDVVKYFYDVTQLKLLSDTTYDWSWSGLFPKETKGYHYSTQNQLDSIWTFKRIGFGPTFALNMTSSITYNSFGFIEKIKSVNYAEDGTITLQTTDSLGYTGTLPYYTYFQEETIDSVINGVYSKRLVMHIGSNNLPDSITWFIGSGNSNTGTYFYEYDSNNNPISTVLSGRRYRFYYETYDDSPMSIKAINSNTNFNIYPNPFDNKINIDWKNAATQAKISLVNMVGQTIYTSNKSLSAGNNVIDLPVPANGNYILLIQDEKGNTYNQKLTKR